MKRFIFTLVFAILPLINYQKVLAASLTSSTINEVGTSVDTSNIDPVKPLQASYVAQTTIEPLYVPLPNPCHSGCGYGSYPMQCTRWAAIVRERMGYPVGNNWGNANDWPGNAKSEGLETGNHPIVGAVAVNMGGQWGHVMVVEAVNPDGSFMITEANYDWQGSIRERLIQSPTGLTFIYF